MVDGSTKTRLSKTIPTMPASASSRLVTASSTGSLSTSPGVSLSSATAVVSLLLAARATVIAAQRETAAQSLGLLPTTSSYRTQTPSRSIATSSSPPSTARLVSPSTATGRSHMTILPKTSKPRSTLSMSRSVGMPIQSIWASIRTT